MNDGPFWRELDRRLMNPDYKDSYDKEFDRQAAAYDALNEWYEPRVVTDFSLTCYKVGQTVKWLGKDNERCEGVVIGATIVDAHGEPNYVIFFKKTVVVVSEISLLHEWEEPPQHVEETPKNTPLLADDEIPF